jgi:hypothetical protein
MTPKILLLTAKPFYAALSYDEVIKLEYVGFMEFI